MRDLTSPVTSKEISGRRAQRGGRERERARRRAEWSLYLFPSYKDQRPNKRTEFGSHSKTFPITRPSSWSIGLPYWLG